MRLQTAEGAGWNALLYLFTAAGGWSASREYYVNSHELTHATVETWPRRLACKTNERSRFQSLAGLQAESGNTLRVTNTHGSSSRLGREPLLLWPRPTLTC